jgi:hypothetical protein
MKMRRIASDSCKRALIVGAFEADGASLDDVKWLFDQSGIVVRTLTEIRACISPDAQDGPK